MKMRATYSPDRKRIWVHFSYNEAFVKRAKNVPGHRFVPPHKGGPAWSYPLEIKTAKLLREEFGIGLKFSDDLIAWGRAKAREDRELRSLSLADDATLATIPEAHPELSAWLRPYQRADIALMSQHGVLNTNEPGLGKTVETIAATLEAGLDDGMHLVVAPVTSLEPVWFDELARWVDPATILTGSTPAARREAAIEALRREEHGEPTWLLINPDLLQWERYVADPEEAKKRRPNKKDPARPKIPELFQIEWHSATIDEFHKMGLSNPGTLGSIGANKLDAKLKFALSGTPMGGKPERLWGALHWINPTAFPSKWQWCDAWLEKKSNGFGHSFGDIKMGRGDEFFKHHAKYIIRRTKAECLPQLPPKAYHEVWCRMTGKQAKQYAKFALDAEVRIDEERLTGTSILAEYTYLKQFAAAACTLADGDLRPTMESGKLPALLDRLERCNVGAGKHAVVATQYSKFAKIVVQYLTEAGISCGLIAGGVAQDERTKLVRQFQKGKGPDVIVIVTQAGGVSITLDAADSVHILDETWNPDDQLQVEDRAHRGSRIHQVDIYYYRSKDTIEEYIAMVTGEKQITSETILDIRRNHFR